VCTPPVAASDARTRPEILRRREVEPRDHLARVGVDIGLVEPVEEHEPVGARRVELLRQMR
jgi:hypothetical protein